MVLQCQFKVTGWGIMFILWHLKIWLEFGPVTADLTTTVLYSYISLINDIKPVHSLTLIFSHKP